jgi:tripartite-type tricarboxylate transporter receptor subunit TctC
MQRVVTVNEVRGSRVRRVLGASLLALALFACSDADAPTRRLDTISIVIPYRAGGGFDRAVRLFAPFYERSLAARLGGPVRILPDNAAGAGGRLGATKVYRASPDGSTLGIFNLPGFVLPEVLGEPVDYDLRKLSWIGRLESEDYLLLVAGSSALRSLEDLRTAARLTFLSTGYGSTVLAASQIVADQLELQGEAPVFLTGYTGTADTLVALIRGDGNVALAPVSSARAYVESGDVRALAVTGAARPLANVPTFAELGYLDLSPLNVQRSLAGPPGMDPELLAWLRTAFLEAVADPGFLALAEGADLTVDPSDGAAVVAEVEASFTYYEKFRSDLSNPNAAGSGR